MKFHFRRSSYTKDKLKSSTLDRNKNDRLTLKEFCTRLPTLIEHSKEEESKNIGGVKSGNQLIGDLLR